MRARCEPSFARPRWSCGTQRGGRCPRHYTVPDARHAAQIHDRPRTSVSACVPKDASLLPHQPEAEGIGEKLTGELVGVEPERDRVDATDCVFCRDSGARPTCFSVNRLVSHKLAHKSFVILEGNDALVLVASSGLLEVHSLLDQPFDPETDRAGK